MSTHTFPRIDHSMDVVNSAISIDVSMGGVIGREAETAQRATLVQVQHINALHIIIDIWKTHNVSMYNKVVRSIAIVAQQTVMVF